MAFYFLSVLFGLYYCCSPPFVSAHREVLPIAAYGTLKYSQLEQKCFSQGFCVTLMKCSRVMFTAFFSNAMLTVSLWP